MNLRAVIFDVDGTIVDNHEAHEDSWIEWCRRHDHPIDRSFYREHLYARSNPTILRTMFGANLPDAQVTTWAAEKEAIYREMYAPVMAPMPGLPELLADFESGGIVFGAASNAERVNVDFVINGLGFRRRFGTTLAVEDVARGKPEPDLFLLAASNLGADPRECLVFEDSATGFEAARRAGMTCIAISGHSRFTPPPAHVKAVHRDFTTITVSALLSLHASLSGK